MINSKNKTITKAVLENMKKEYRKPRLTIESLLKHDCITASADNLNDVSRAVNDESLVDFGLLDNMMP